MQLRVMLGCADQPTPTPCRATVALHDDQPRHHGDYSSVLADSATSSCGVDTGDRIAENACDVTGMIRQEFNPTECDGNAARAPLAPCTDETGRTATPTTENPFTVGIEREHHHHRAERGVRGVGVTHATRRVTHG